jgi:tuberculosinol/isotuberculosinol synthase
MTAETLTRTPTTLEGTSLDEFLELPTERVARLVQGDGPKTCVFPINGTRRWFLLEHPDRAQSSQSYIETYMKRSFDIFGLFFDHGIDTVLSPIFGPDLMARGEAYRLAVMPAQRWLLQQRALEFYERHGVRVRFYGDFHRYFENTPYVEVEEMFDELTRRTSQYGRHRLFFGVCAHDATETVAQIGIRFHRQHGRPPNKREIVEAYYGEHVDPVSFFIGFGQPTVFDMPLVATGNEDLYFTVSPSLYMDEKTLRSILYDHLYTRRLDEKSYGSMSENEWRKLAAFYAENRHRVLGLGHRYNDHFWCPLPQVRVPPCLENDIGTRALQEETK